MAAPRVVNTAVLQRAVVERNPAGERVRWLQVEVGIVLMERDCGPNPHGLGPQSLSIRTMPTSTWSHRTRSPAGLRSTTARWRTAVFTTRGAAIKQGSVRTNHQA